eukprot:IDg8633t1
MFSAAVFAVACSAPDSRGSSALRSTRQRAPRWLKFALSSPPSPLLFFACRYAAYLSVQHSKVFSSPVGVPRGFIRGHGAGASQRYQFNARLLVALVQYYLLIEIFLKKLCCCKVLSSKALLLEPESLPLDSDESNLPYPLSPISSAAARLCLSKRCELHNQTAGLAEQYIEDRKEK